MKQIWPNYSYSPTTNVLTLTGLNIDRDQLLLVTAADRGRIMYNFADSSVTASAFTSGANTALTLVATTAGLTTTAALVIYYDDQVSGISGTVTANVLGTSQNGIAYSLPIAVNDSAVITRGVAIGFNDTDDSTFYNVSKLRPLPISTPYGVTIPNSVTIGSLPAISGTVTIGSSLPDGTNRIGVVTIGAGTVTLGASTSQIGSVTAFLAYSQTTVSLGSTTATAIPIVLPTNGIYGGTLQGYNGTNTYIYSGIQAIGNTSLAGATSLPVSLGSLPALVAGTAQIGSVTASISGTVPVSGTFFQTTQPVSLATVPTHGVTLASTTVTVSSLPAISGTVTASFAISATPITSGSFASLTSATLVPSDITRKMATVFNQGAGQLFINAGATATTAAGGFMVALNAGDFYECNYTTTTLSAIFATAGTASWVSH